MHFIILVENAILTVFNYRILLNVLNFRREINNTCKLHREKEEV